MPEKARELALHFETQGTPVMIGRFGGYGAPYFYAVKYRSYVILLGNESAQNALESKEKKLVETFEETKSIAF